MVAVAVVIGLVGVGCIWISGRVGRLEVTGGPSENRELFIAVANELKKPDVVTIEAFFDTRVMASDAETIASMDSASRSILADALLAAKFIRTEGDFSEYKIHLDDGVRSATDISVFVTKIDGQPKLRFVE